MFFSYHKMVFRNHRRFRLEPQNIFRDLKIFFYEPQHKSWLLALHPELITETCCQSPSVILCHTMVAMTHSYHLSRAFSALHRHSSHKWSTLKIELACLETQFRFFYGDSLQPVHWGQDISGSAVSHPFPRRPCQNFIEIKVGWKW